MVEADPVQIGQDQDTLTLKRLGGQLFGLDDLRLGLRRVVAARRERGAEEIGLGAEGFETGFAVDEQHPEGVGHLDRRRAFIVAGQSVRNASKLNGDNMRAGVVQGGFERQGGFPARWQRFPLLRGAGNEQTVDP